MRKLGYSLAITLLLAVLALGLYDIYRSYGPDVNASEVFEGYRRINTYVLQHDKPLRFKYPNSSLGAKFLIHAVTAHTEAEKSTPEPLAFSIDYLVGDSSDVNSKTFTTRVSDYRHVETNEPQPIYSLNNAKLLVSDSNTFELSLLNLDMKAIKLSLGTLDPRIKQVLIRPFYRVGSSVRNADIKWARLSRHEQNRLARFHPLGRGYISSDEIRNVLENRNLAIAPSGIEGVEFRTQPMQVYDQPDKILTTRLSEQSAYIEKLSSTLKRGVRVFEPTTLMIAAENLSAESEKNTAHYRYKTDTGEITKTSIPVDGKIIELPLSPGDYVFTADALMTFVITDTPQADTQGRRSTFFSLEQQNISFPLNESEHSEQLLKIEILAKPMAVCNIRASFRDAENSVVTQQDISHQEGANYFLHSGRSEDIETLSGVSSTMIRVAANSKSIELASSLNSPKEHCYIKVSNSLDVLSSKVSITGLKTEFISKWFTLAPNNKKPTTESLIAAAQPPNSGANRNVEFDSKALHVINYGRYQLSNNDQQPIVRTLVPIGTQKLTTVYEVNPQSSGGSTSAILFSKIEINKRLAWNLNESYNSSVTSVRPRAFYINHDNAETNVQFTIDGKRYNFALPYNSGEVQLPNTEIGNHTIKVTAPNSVQIFVNLIPQTDASLKRQELYVTNGDISFESPKPIQDNELVQLVVAQKDSLPTTTFDLQIDNLASGSVLLKRRYSINTTDENISGLVGGGRTPTLRVLSPIHLKSELGFAESGNRITLKFEDGIQRFVAVKVLDQSGTTLGKSYLDRLGQ